MQESRQKQKQKWQPLSDKDKRRLKVELLAAVGVFFSRFRLLPANVSPLGSFGFFSQNVWLYFGSIIAFDVIRGGLYSGFWWTYIGFASYLVWGRLARSSTKRRLVLLPVASFTFFLVSNFGVWWHWYPHTWEGLLACYLAAVPFYRNTLLGDVVFGYGYMGIKRVLNKVSVDEKFLFSMGSK